MTMLEAYPQDALDELLANVTSRQGWDFSRMKNRVLAGNVDERGFVTNEHRYLAIAQRAAAELRLAGGHRSGRRDAGYGTPRPPAGGARGPSGW